MLTGFQYYSATYNLGIVIQNGLTWLLGKQNPDGGFGNSPSTVYDMAAAMLVLKALNVSSVSVRPWTGS